MILTNRFFIYGYLLLSLMIFRSIFPLLWPLLLLLVEFPTDKRKKMKTKPKRKLKIYSEGFCGWRRGATKVLLHSIFGVWKNWKWIRVSNKSNSYNDDDDYEKQKKNRKWNLQNVQHMDDERLLFCDAPDGIGVQEKNIVRIVMMRFVHLSRFFICHKWT